MNEFKAQEEEQDRKRQEITSRLAPKNVILRHSGANDRRIFHIVSGRRSISARKINKYQFELSGS